MSSAKEPLARHMITQFYSKPTTLTRKSSRESRPYYGVDFRRNRIKCLVDFRTIPQPTTSRYNLSATILDSEHYYTIFIFSSFCKSSATQFRHFMGSIRRSIDQGHRRTDNRNEISDDTSDRRAIC